MRKAPDFPVEQRRGFIAPRFNISVVNDGNTIDWQYLPVVSPLVNNDGSAIDKRDTTIQIALDGENIYLHACGTDDAIVSNPDFTVDSNKFWRNDHIEFRLMPDIAQTDSHLQFIISLDGRCWDNRGLYKEMGIVKCIGGIDGNRWQIDLRVNIAGSSMEKAVADRVIYGITAHTRWADNWPDIACCSAMELGFGQSERFAEFILTDEIPAVICKKVSADEPVLKPGLNKLILTIQNNTTAEITGTMMIDGNDMSAVLKPGCNELCLAVELLRDTFSYLPLTFASTDIKCELVVLSLRSDLTDFNMVKDSRHPYLLFNMEELMGLREKAVTQPFDRMCPVPTMPINDISFVDSLDFTPHCMNWFRVAKESMLRDGENNLKPASQRIWSLFSPDEQEVWRDIVRTVVVSREQLDVLIPALNTMMKRRDFYTDEAFRDLALTAASRELIMKRDVINNAELTLLNRSIFQATIECCHKYNLQMATMAGSFLYPWIMTGNNEYIRMATKAADIADRTMIIGPYTDLHEGMTSSMLAQSYDVFYPYLSTDEKNIWLRLMTKFLNIYLATARAYNWNCTTIANANPVCNGGGALLAMSLLREEPELAIEAIKYARRYIWNWLDYCHGNDGGNTEGAQYWEYGMQNFIMFVYVLERLTGSDDGMLSHPAIQKSMNMIRVGMSNDGGMHGVNDTIPLAIGGHTAWFVAGRLNDDFALWYGDFAFRYYQERRDKGLPDQYASTGWWPLLFRPQVPELFEQPPLPTVILLNDIQYASMRSGTNYDSVWSAGIKGSRPRYTHHNQADTGAIYIDYRGDRMIIDPGYYKPHAEDHSLLLINGIGPDEPTGYTGKIIKCLESSDIRYLVCDSTKAYKGLAKRAVRQMVMIGEEAVIILDDIVPSASDSSVTAQYQCGGITSKNGENKVKINGNHSSLQMEFFNINEIELDLLSESSLHDTHWGYHFADCRLFPVNVKFTATEKYPLISVFVDGKYMAETQVKYCDRELIIILSSGRKVLFAFIDDEWVLEMKAD